MIISTLKSRIERKLGGISLGKISGFYDLVGEAAGNILMRIDPQETIRIAQITNAVHNDVYDYSLPSDFKAPADTRPQVNRTLGSNMANVGIKEFDLYKALSNGDARIAIKNNDGTKSLRISQSLGRSPVLINAANGLTDNGTWAVVGDGTNLTADTLDYISGSTSLNFDTGATATAGGIANSTMTAVDLTDHDEKSTLFVWVYIPDSALVTNWILRWGNDASNYWSRTVTTAHDSTAFRNGWNLLAFQWNGATETGTVAPASIDYLDIRVTHTATADTDYRIDNIVSSLGSIWEIVYYSKFLFRSSASTWLEVPTADTDTINLDSESNNILVYETLKLLAPEIMEEDASFDVNFYDRELNGADLNHPGLYALYERRYPSQRLKQRNTYYRIR